MGLLRHVYYGDLVHCSSDEQLVFLKHTACAVDENGFIAWIDKIEHDIQTTVNLHRGWKNAEVVHSKSPGFFFPGFIDTHIHASQYPNAGLFGMSRTTLLDWLQKYTFPVEKSLSDPELAKMVYTKCVQRTVANGTTTAAYYATIQSESTCILAETCYALGQRALIGRCSMDANSPDWYKDKSVDGAIGDTERTIEHIRKLDSSRQFIVPIITPRFAPACSSALLNRLGGLADAEDLGLQTHIAEHQDEVAWVKKLFPQCKSYGDVYDRHGILTPRTILAHGIYLSDEERELIRQRGCSVSHCPLSNMALASGLARVRWLRDSGITVALGTDISGGVSPSLLDAARQAVLVSNMVSLHEGPRARVGVEEALYMATLAGAKALGMETKIGSFEVGKSWDAVMVDLTAEQSGVDVFPWHSDAQWVEKWFYTGDDRNIRQVWVQGRAVKTQARS